MLLGKYFVSNHALNQYDERVEFKRKGDILSSIKYDLRTLNIRHIIRVKDHIYVFTKNSKEFVFVRTKKGTLCLRTVIKRNPDDTQRTIEKRKALATC
ncbi:MAG TPA: hypothetical protein VK190_04985 [Pseudoneobacillus sp.]|nr:hypothetical protein [Pseudoneobacillus sp.]